MSRCKHDRGTLRGRGEDGVDRVCCAHCAVTLEETPPELRDAVDRFYANPSTSIGAVNALGSIELAKAGRKGGHR